MVAYISRLNLPDPAANAGQTIQMAAALAEQTGSTGLFVHDLSLDTDQLRTQYNLRESPLRFWPLHARRWPFGLYNRGFTRFLTYNTAVAIILGTNPAWKRSTTQPKVIFVRSRLETLYWGMMRPYLWWLRDWLFVCEVHDLPGPLSGDRQEKQRAERLARALKNYDLVIAVTRGLAEDIQALTGDQVHPEIVPLCTGLPRLPSPPAFSPSNGPLRLGYTGTIDQAHGIHDLLDAIKLLPENFILRLVGRIREDARLEVEEAVRSGRVETRGFLPYAEMDSEIDSCHFLLVPAGAGQHSTRYRSPLKIFDYLARGRPILAADVPSHQELLQDGVHAVLYRPGDPADLAMKIQALAADPEKVRAISTAAWQASEVYTYEARACRLVRLFEQRYSRRSSRIGRPKG